MGEKVGGFAGHAVFISEGHYDTAQCFDLVLVDGGARRILRTSGWIMRKKRLTKHQPPDYLGNRAATLVVTLRGVLFQKQSRRKVGLKREDDAPIGAAHASRKLQVGLFAVG